MISSNEFVKFLSGRLSVRIHLCEAVLSQSAALLPINTLGHAGVALGTLALVAVRVVNLSAVPVHSVARHLVVWH